MSAFLENLKNWICTFCCFSNNWQVERLYLFIQHIFHIIRNFKVIFFVWFCSCTKKVLFFLRTRDSEFLKLWHSINICNKKIVYFTLYAFDHRPARIFSFLYFIFFMSEYNLILPLFDSLHLGWFLKQFFTSVKETNQCYYFCRCAREMSEEKN